MQVLAMSICHEDFKFFCSYELVNRLLHFRGACILQDTGNCLAVDVA